MRGKLNDASAAAAAAPIPFIINNDNLLQCIPEYDTGKCTYVTVLYPLHRLIFLVTHASQYERNNHSDIPHARVCSLYFVWDSAAGEGGGGMWGEHAICNVANTT